MPDSATSEIVSPVDNLVESQLDAARKKYNCPLKFSLLLILREFGTLFQGQLDAAYQRTSPCCFKVSLLLPVRKFVFVGRYVYVFL